jgi:hypothetical protein
MRPVEHKPPTEVKPFSLPGDERVRKRRSFDRRQKLRLEAEEREREARRRAEEEQEQREYEEARRQTAFKANPIPGWVKLRKAAAIPAPDFSDSD